MSKIIITPGNHEIANDENLSLRDNLIKAGHKVKSPCGGCASCGQCVVVVAAGESNLTEISFEEKQILGNVFHITKERLSCQTRAFGDVTVDISTHLEIKVAPKTSRRTPDQVKKIKDEREEIRKNKDPKQGGFKRPTAFRPEKDEE